MNPLAAFFSKLPACAEIAARLGPAPVTARGLWGSAAACLSAAIAHAARRPLLLITPHADEADDARDDVFATIGRTPELIPVIESFGAADAPADEEAQAERLRLVLALADLHSKSLLVAPVQALMQPVSNPAHVLASALRLERNQTIDPQRVGDWLIEAGYTLCEQVETPGDFSRRGGIVDVFGLAQAQPVRVEFCGDQIESIRLFDAGTQRSAEALASATVAAMPGVRRSRANASDSETVSLMSLLPRDTLVALHEPTEIVELGRTYWQRLGERRGLIPVDAVLRAAAGFAQVFLRRFDDAEAAAVDCGFQSLPQFEPRTGEALRALEELAREAHVTVLCDSQPEADRFDELLREPVGRASSDEAPAREAMGFDPTLRPRVSTAVGVLHRGFRHGEQAFVPHHEIFQRFRQRRTLRRVQPARPIDSFFDLSAGDHVVHAIHGIGRFRGLQPVERAGRTEEYLTIEYADEALVHVPTSQVHLVQKYIGSARGRPKLSKVGGTLWKRTKERVASAVFDMAGDLLRIQAERATQPGTAYPADTRWQGEFEGSFPYTETEDQLRALAEIKTDLCRTRPMDRLLCGDVGYGKTELAMRAAFKVVEYGRQVAVLVPTTVLAEQHFQSFRERFADYPFTIESLSRFRTKAEQSRIVERAGRGQVDILIGTHRLLSKDVRFADLGLVVIDEEQRFGVEAKERLKRLRATVEVLTLTATPIPRTLHMAMLGIREISSLATAPVDRRAVVTQVRMWEDGLIREAILRELNRDGQVYFVHNFVRDIHAVANQIRTLVPDARVVCGHGQMAPAELEEVMLAFMRREADVLVSTNIIESGIDIPRANTIFIHRAERFGLADLHQLRGRVGRSHHRAYCYLLLSPRYPVKDPGARRLKAIEQYSQLGAGFQIAMRDLEIRGAGNILGPEQSGNIEAVGYEMYCQLLEQAVRRLRNEPAEPWQPTHLEIDLSASIPRGYIRSERQRMEVYKRLAASHTVADVEALAHDLRDAFGQLPADVATLISMAEVRVRASGWGVRSIVLKPPDVIFAVDDFSRAEPLFAHGPGSPRAADLKTVHWRLPKRLLEPEALLQTLLAQLRGTERSGATTPAPVPARS